MIIYALGIVEQAGKILFLLRKNTKFFSDHYGLVGGKVEDGESVATALIRELQEEIGITVTRDDMYLAHCISIKNEHGKDLIALVFKINHWQGKLINCEPEKQAEIAWFSYDALPENIIPRHRQVLEMVHNNVLYSENGW